MQYIANHGIKNYQEITAQLLTQASVSTLQSKL